MALVRCPFCKAKISQFAEKCPKCGKSEGGRCPECGTPRTEDELACSECGFPFEKLSETDDDHSSQSSDAPAIEYTPGGPEQKGLATAFWGYNVAPSALLNSGIIALTSDLGTLTVSGAVFASVILIIGGLYFVVYAWPLLWDSANRYLGPVRWRVLAKTYVVLNAFSLVGGFAIVLESWS